MAALGAFTPSKLHKALQAEMSCAVGVTWQLKWFVSLNLY